MECILFCEGKGCKNEEGDSGNRKAKEDPIL